MAEVFAGAILVDIALSTFLFVLGGSQDRGLSMQSLLKPAETSQRLPTSSKATTYEDILKGRHAAQELACP